jgi:hypothetical protein
MQHIQLDLFPIADLETRGYAEPEPRDTETDAVNDEQRAEAA